MKKRVLALLLALVMVLGMLPTAALAADSDFTIENGVLTWYRGSGGDVVIPNGVTSIGRRAFATNGKVTSVTIPSGVTSIGESAFDNCHALVNISIPNTVTSIGNKAFVHCTSLSNVTIPDGVTEVGTQTFYGCTNLTSISIPDSVTSIGDHAFENCKNLINLTIPNSVSSIRSGAFRNCSALTAVTISDNLPAIEVGVFAGCSNLTNIVFPDSITHIESLAFSQCSKLANVTISNADIHIEEMAFYQCDSLKDIYFAGTETQWRRCVVIGRNDKALLSATIHYNSTGPEGPDTPDVAPSITVTGGDREIEVGERGTIYANASNPSGREGRTWTWTSSDANIVSFSENSPVDHMEGVDPILNEGKKETVYCNINFYGRSPGTATLTCTLDDGTVSGPVQIVVVGKDPSISGPTLFDLTYSFGNNTRAYGYSSSYRIPLARYQLMFGNTALAQYYYANSGSWGGNCYGMSSTSCLFFESGNGVSTSAFRSGADLPSELSVRDRSSSWNLTLTEFIEAMQVGQNGRVIQSDYQNNRNQLNRLCQAVESFQQTGRDPVVIAVFGNEGGHAIVGYDIVDVSSAQSHLMVYDCNFPNTERYITLTKNSSGQYTGWYYHLNDMYDWGSSYSGSWISYVPYSHFLQSWNDRKGAESVNLLSVNTTNAAIKDVDGNVIANIRNGQVETDRDDIYPLVNIGLTTDGAYSGAAGTSVWLPSDSLYTVENTDRSVSSFEATMVNVEQSATVSTTASEVIFAVNDEQKMTYAKLGETSGDSYTITLSSTLDNSYGDVELKGTATEDSAPVLAQISGKLYADGVDMSSASLRVDGAAKTESILSGTLPQNSLLGTTGVSLPTVEKIPVAGTAYARTQTVKLDGKNVEFQCYALKNAQGNETNYVKLRDLAVALNGTKAQFNAGWDQVSKTISIIPGAAYKAVGGEGATPFSGDQPYTAASGTPISFRGASVRLTSILLQDSQKNGYTYYKLADLGQLLNFSVRWANGVVIETDKPYSGK